MQYALGICGLIAFVAVAAFLPETTHPKTRGVDRLQESLKASGQPHRKYFWVNPLASLWLLRSPNISAVVCIAIVANIIIRILFQSQALVGMFALITDYGESYRNTLRPSSPNDPYSIAHTISIHDCKFRFKKPSHER